MAARSSGCLAGIKIIDLSMWVAGPFCSQTLGDHGAEIVRIEPPGGDIGRKLGPSFNEHGFSGYDFSLSRNKRSIALDLATAEGKAVLFRLLEEADVLLSNFRPGVLEKLGFGYREILAERFPRLIAASVTAYGNSGPLGDLAGMDPAGQAMGGLMSRQGAPDGPPERLSVSAADLSAALYLTIGILAALIERERSGRGQEVQTSLLESALTLNHPHAADWLMTGNEPRRLGNGHPNVAPLNVYKCRDGYASIACANDAQFRTLCEVLGKPEMAEDPRFRDAKSRVRNSRAIDTEIEALCAQRGKMDITMELMKLAIPAAPILSMGEALSHPQVAAREMIVEDSSIGFRGVGTPIKLSRTPGGLYRRPARFGEHSREILRGAGFTDEEIDALIAGRVVFPSNDPPSVA